MRTLRDFDSGSFLRDTWQQRPLLIRNPWDAWDNPLSPDELAGLACEEGVDSRLIRQEDRDWMLEHGPLADERFGHLGRGPWTLLVQSVDHYVPEVAALLDQFRFVANWRVDDVMVSYAVDGGGVGAHFDHYDVFLVQGLGRRRWRIGPRCDDSTPTLPHDELRLLAEFEPTDEFVLEPGDILYVPPGFAHDGIAVGDDCMTYSIGFRAPSRAELVSGWSGEIVDGLGDDDRYTDPGAAPQANAGEIGADALAELHGMVTDPVGDRAAFARWFGAFTTEPKSALDWRPETVPGTDALRDAIAAGTGLLRNPASRFAFVREGAGRVALFVDGQAYDCDGAAAGVAEAICAASTIEPDPAVADNAEVMALLAELIAEGALALDL
ncbi:JmjC domain-containing protein [Parablastomonas sp. CN1-191]|uniref:JmjC domain-containing protein n=1 Tax=Parablastomonas sp. CN1-191 TaxID=3400908 RepID=UPI003BF8830F